LNTSTSRKLVITEGVETGLAVLAAHDYRVTVWSLISAVNMGMAEVPDGLFDEVVIYADHDPVDPHVGYRPGEHFAEMLKESLLARSIKCRIVMPSTEGGDFADMWCAGDSFELCG
jgi:putative DNA primase/helicase